MIVFLDVSSVCMQAFLCMQFLNKSGKHPEHIRNMSGFFAEHFRNMSGKNPVNFRNKSGKVTEHVRNIIGTFPEVFGKIPENVWKKSLTTEILGTFPEKTNPEIFQKKYETYPDNFRKMFGFLPDVSSVCMQALTEKNPETFQNKSGTFLNFCPLNFRNISGTIQETIR